MNQDINKDSSRSGIAFHHPIAFWAGTVSLVAGVVFHVYLFSQSAPLKYKMVNMPMDDFMMVGMWIAMGLILGGVMTAGYGLFPPKEYRRKAKEISSSVHLKAMDNASLSGAHWKMILALAVASIVDTMKPATLGFAAPGMMGEYDISKSSVAFLPFFALIGMVTGSFVWGLLSDKLGRRSSILLAVLLFMGTAICGAMPTFAWNVLMCFFMGASAGGLLPITFALLAETVPTRHRGWLLVMLGAIGTAGGYLAASGAAALLEGYFGWRILWLLGLPTGIVLVLFNHYIPESPRLLLVQGRDEEALKVMERFGIEMASEEELSYQLEPVTYPELESVTTQESASVRVSLLSLLRRPYFGLTLGLVLYGLAWGLVNFGFLLWLPTNLKNLGLTMGALNFILAKSAIITVFTIPLVVLLYQKWSTKNSMVLFAIVIASVLLSFTLFNGGSILKHTNLLTACAVLLLFGISGAISILLPYSSEVYPSHIRGTGTGMVAGSSKAGGLIGVSFIVAAIIPGLITSALITAFPILLSAFILGKNGIETRGQQLEEINKLINKQTDK